MEDEKSNPMSISFDPHDREHLDTIKNMIYSGGARCALSDFRNKLRRIINKGEVEDHILNQVDEEWRPTKEEVTKASDYFWHLLDECFEYYDAEEFLKDY